METLRDLWNKTCISADIPAIVNRQFGKDSETKILRQMQKKLFI